MFPVFLKNLPIGLERDPFEKSLPSVIGDADAAWEADTRRTRIAPAAVKSAKILSVDPGVKNVGFAIMSSAQCVVFCGVIRTVANHQLHTRIKQIRRRLQDLYRKYECTLLVLEDFHGMPSMAGRLDLAKAHGAIQSVEAHIRLIRPGLIFKSKKKGNIARKKRAVQLVKKFFKVNLRADQHHAADAILQGRYYYTERGIS